jgi:hypothetical protein
MRKLLIAAVAVVLLSGAVLGGTVFHEPIAQAATQVLNVFVTNDSTHPVPTKEQNLDASGNIKVHEQGIANVNVSNASIPVNGTVSVTPGNSYLTASGKLTANGTITVNTTKYTYVSVHIWYENLNNPNAQPMQVAVVDGAGVYMETDTIDPTFLLSKVFTAPGTGMSLNVFTSDWTGIDAQYAIYGRA